MSNRAWRSSLWLVSIPLVAAAVATTLFLVQRGFGAGHGRFDQAIGFLGLPSVLVVEMIPLPALIGENDLLLVVWVPAALNCLLWLAIGLAIQARRNENRPR